MWMQSNPADAAENSICLLRKATQTKKKIQKILVFRLEGSATRQRRQQSRLAEQPLSILAHTEMEYYSRSRHPRKNPVNKLDKPTESQKGRMEYARI